MRISEYPRRPILAILFCAIALGFAQCSSKPKGPDLATPEGRYAAAKDAFAQAKYDKVLEYTGKILRETPDHTVAPAAQLLQLTVFAGLSEGYRQLGLAYHSGMSGTRLARDYNALRKVLYDYYRLQKTYALNYSQAVEKMLPKLDPNKPVRIDIPYPVSEAAPRTALERVRKSVVIGDEELKRDEEQELKAGVLSALAMNVGAEKDLAKAKQMLQAGPVERPSGEWVLTQGRVLLDQAELFNRRTLMESTHFKAFCEKSMNCATKVSEWCKVSGDKKLAAQADKLKKDAQEVLKRG